MKQMKYFSDNEQGMPPRTLTEINVDIWNVPSTSLYSPNVLRYYRKCFWNSKSKLAASPNGDKSLVPLEIEPVVSANSTSPTVDSFCSEEAIMP